MIEAVADHDDDIMAAFLEDEAIEQDKLKAAIRAATLDISITPVLLGSAFKNKGVQPLLDAVIDYLPSPMDVPPVTGTDPKTGEPTEREARLDAPFSALAFKVMSDPFVGKLTYFRVYSGKLNSGSYVLNPAPAARSGSAACSRCTPTTARTSTRSAPARSPPPSGSSRRPPATRCATRCAGAARVHRLPRSGHRRGRRAEDQGRPGQADRGAAAAGRGGPDLPRAHQRGDRPDHHRRHGRAAPGDHRRPAAARVQGRRQRRPPAGGLPRDDPQRGARHPRPVRPPVRRPRPVRRRRHRHGAERAGRRLRVREQDRRRHRSRASTSRRSTPASRRRWRRACWPASRWSTSRSRWSTAATTTSTRRRWRSRSPARWPSRRPRKAPSRCCWSP